jgi:hypothetical protein
MAKVLVRKGSSPDDPPEYAVPRQAIAEFKAEIARLSPEPFQQLLADFMGCGPDPENIKRFACMYPDKWIAALKNLAHLAGYREETLVMHQHDLKKMSDAELEQAIIDLKAEDVEYEDVGGTPTAVAESCVGGEGVPPGPMPVILYPENPPSFVLDDDISHDSGVFAAGTAET